MDRLIKAAREGNIDEIYNQITNDPHLLKRIDEIPFVHTPLHEAANAGQTRIVIELMTLMPSFARKLNPQGLSPLHVAVINEQNDDHSDRERKKGKKNETAIAMIKSDAELIRVKGKQRMTPLHHAAKENNSELLAEFLCFCPNSIDDLTDKSQSAVHIAVKEKNSEAFEVLFGWLVRRNISPDVLGLEDKDRNTALHIAVQTQQADVVRRLIPRVKRNTLNSNNLTALDIANHQGGNSPDLLRIKRNLTNLGGRSAKDLPKMETLSEFLSSKEGFAEGPLRWLLYLEKKMSLDLRNVILVVAVLIVTATFQGVLQPPGGFSQGSAAEAVSFFSTRKLIDPNPNPNPNLNPYSNRNQNQNRYPAAAKYNHHHNDDTAKSAGRVVMSDRNSNAFMSGNTVAFILATVVIIAALPGRPIILVLHLSLLFLTYNYLTTIRMISNLRKDTKLLLDFSWIIICVAVWMRICLSIAKAMLRDAWWLPWWSKLATNSLYQLPFDRKIIHFGYRLKLQNRVTS